MRQRSRGDKGNGALLSSVFPEIKNETTMNKLPSWLVMMETFFFSLRGDKQIMSPLYPIFKESAGTWGGGGGGNADQETQQQQEEEKTVTALRTDHESSCGHQIIVVL